jgi:hypothetical protein
MKLLELEIDDAVFEKLKGFLEILPKTKVRIKEIFNDTHIPYVSDEEQKNIERRLKNKSCHVVAHSKIIKI